MLFSVPDPAPSTMTALHLFGAEMLKLSRGLDSVSPKFERKEISHASLNNRVNATDIPTKEPCVKSCELSLEKSKPLKTIKSSKRNRK